MRGILADINVWKQQPGHPGNLDFRYLARSQERPRIGRGTVPKHGAVV